MMESAAIPEEGQDMGLFAVGFGAITSSPSNSSFSSSVIEEGEEGYACHSDKGSSGSEEDDDGSANNSNNNNHNNNGNIQCCAGEEGASSEDEDCNLLSRSRNNKKIMLSRHHCSNNNVKDSTIAAANDEDTDSDGSDSVVEVSVPLTKEESMRHRNRTPSNSLTQARQGRERGVSFTRVNIDFNKFRAIAAAAGVGGTSATSNSGGAATPATTPPPSGLVSTDSSACCSNALSKEVSKEVVPPPPPPLSAAVAGSGTHSKSEEVERLSRRGSLVPTSSGRGHHMMMKRPKRALMTEEEAVKLELQVEQQRLADKLKHLQQQQVPTGVVVVEESSPSPSPMHITASPDVGKVCSVLSNARRRRGSSILQMSKAQRERVASIISNANTHSTCMTPIPQTLSPTSSPSSRHASMPPLLMPTAATVGATTLVATTSSAHNITVTSSSLNATTSVGGTGAESDALLAQLELDEFERQEDQELLELFCHSDDEEEHHKGTRRKHQRHTSRADMSAYLSSSAAPSEAASSPRPPCKETMSRVLMVKTILEKGRQSYYDALQPQQQSQQSGGKVRRLRGATMTAAEPPTHCSERNNSYEEPLPLPDVTSKTINSPRRARRRSGAPNSPRNNADSLRVIDIKPIIHNPFYTCSLDFSYCALRALPMQSLQAQFPEPLDEEVCDMIVAEHCKTMNGGNEDKNNNSTSSTNNTDNIIPHFIMPSFTELLVELNISNNHAAALPDNFGVFTSLKRLVAKRNRLATVPPSLCMCEDLHFLDLSNNLLSELPEEYADLNALEELVLDYNRFSSLPPCVFHGMGALKKLYMIENAELRAIVPKELCESFNNNNNNNCNSSNGGPEGVEKWLEVRLANHATHQQKSREAAVRILNSHLPELIQYRQNYLSGNSQSAVPDSPVRSRGTRLLSTSSCCPESPTAPLDTSSNSNSNSNGGFAARKRGDIANSSFVEVNNASMTSSMLNMSVLSGTMANSNNNNNVLHLQQQAQAIPPALLVSLQQHPLVEPLFELELDNTPDLVRDYGRLCRLLRSRAIETSVRDTLLAVAEELLAAYFSNNSINCPNSNINHNEALPTCPEFPQFLPSGAQQRNSLVSFDNNNNSHNNVLSSGSHTPIICGNSNPNTSIMNNNTNTLNINTNNNNKLYSNSFTAVEPDQPITSPRPHRPRALTSLPIPPNTAPSTESSTPFLRPALRHYSVSNQNSSSHNNYCNGNNNNNITSPPLAPVSQQLFTPPTGPTAQGTVPTPLCLATPPHYNNNNNNTNININNNNPIDLNNKSMMEASVLLNGKAEASYLQHHNNQQHLQVQSTLLRVSWNKVFPDDIIEGVCLGSLRTVQNVAVLHELGITHVLTCGRNLDTPLEFHRVYANVLKQQQINNNNNNNKNNNNNNNNNSGGNNNNNNNNGNSVGKVGRTSSVGMSGGARSLSPMRSNNNNDTSSNDNNSISNNNNTTAIDNTANNNTTNSTTSGSPTATTPLPRRRGHTVASRPTHLSISSNNNNNTSSNNINTTTNNNNNSSNNNNNTPILDSCGKKRIEQLILEVDDNEHENLQEHFSRAFAFIDAAKAGGGKALVHCFAGVSRSATVVVAYVMRHNNTGFKEALRVVQKRRPAANPNPNFRKQLMRYEAYRNSNNSNNNNENST